MTDPDDGDQFGELGAEGFRSLVVDLAAALYRPLHDGLVAAHLEKVRDWDMRSAANKTPNTPRPVFDDSDIWKLWRHCIVRAKLQAVDGRRFNLDLDAPPFPGP